MRFVVRVQPNAGRTVVGGRYGQNEPPVLLVRVAAPAVDGKANAACTRALADALGVPPRAVTILAGHGSRTKTIQATGAAPAALDRLLRA